MALKHLTRLTITRPSGIREDVFINDAGFEVDALVRFARHLDTKGYRATTAKRYVEAAARFVDFLIECQVFGRPARQDIIAGALDVYPLFLRDGVEVEGPAFPDLSDYAEDIGLRHGLARNSFAPVLAATNLFLRLGRAEAENAMSILRDQGLVADLQDLAVTFAAIDGVEAWSGLERERLKQHTLIGGCVRIRGQLERPRGLRSPLRGGSQVDLENKDFPLEHLSDLLDAARSHRDRALYALLAGGGLRLHEALNLRLSDIDATTGEVWVVDPDNRRFGREMPKRDRLRFKGRAMSRVYLYEPLLSRFWDEMRAYLRSEYVGTADDEQFLFKKLDGQGRGEALNDASDTALQKQFKAAVLRAGVEGPREAPDHVWTLHSLRHSYGVYMLNFIPVPGGAGLKLTEVQMLMGHASPESTQVYARHDRLLTEARVAAANEFLDIGEPGAAEARMDFLPASIAARLRQTADRIDRAAG
ncbi:Phage integrase family protein [Methylobacterium phyllostachyos]|uniref:Phage integrase family protein n=2 Tax=Methylobacterium phyllostachyos TaxID=582672 RepID=A0A1G9TLZ5_9HYPH|nr:Phage integrase family protein [Methylobacterium phyllostachyos]